jgi:hypothetical protein
MTTANLQGFPLGTVAPYVNGQPFLGGEILILLAAASNTNSTFAHTLRRVPHAYWVLDVGRNMAMLTPFERGSTAWTQSLVSFNLPLITYPVTGVLF